MDYNNIKERKIEMKKVNRNNKKIIADILYRCIKSGKANFKELADKIKNKIKNKNAIDIIKKEIKNE